MSTKVKSLTIGLLLCGVCAAAGWGISLVCPLIGSAVGAMFIGMGLAYFLKGRVTYSDGSKFASKKLLRLAIITLGFSINFALLKKVGAESLIVMSVTLISAYLCAWVFGKWLKIGFNQRNLIATGTGICGGSAIAAVSPILDASEEDIGHAMAATFFFDILAVLVFPMLGHALGLSDHGYGIWAGTAVNDTSSVVAAGFAFSEEAGKISTIVKMTRTCALFPIALLLIFAVNYRKRRETGVATATGTGKYNLLNFVPGFLMVFVAVVVFNSIVPLPTALVEPVKGASHVLIAFALAGVGLNIDLVQLFKKGGSSLLLGGIVSVEVVLATLLVQYFCNIW